MLLKKAPVQYGKSYLYSETDQMDLTYFIEYQASIITRAVETFKAAYKHAVLDIEEFNAWLGVTGLDKQLTDNQKAVLKMAKSGTQASFSSRDVEKYLGCSYNTAAAVLNALVTLKLFSKTKQGREWLYALQVQTSHAE